MAIRSQRNDPPPRRPIPVATLSSLFDSSGRRWFILGSLLLVIMGVAVWTVRRDPLAISALFFAIAAILGTVPKIMEARARILYGTVPEPENGTAADETGGRAE
jgi:hypothetical protein